MGTIEYYCSTFIYVCLLSHNFCCCLLSYFLKMINLNQRYWFNFFMLFWLNYCYPTMVATKISKPFVFFVSPSGLRFFFFNIFSCGVHKMQSLKEFLRKLNIKIINKLNYHRHTCHSGKDSSKIKTLNILCTVKSFFWSTVALVFIAISKWL